MSSVERQYQRAILKGSVEGHRQVHGITYHAIGYMSWNRMWTLVHNQN